MNRSPWSLRQAYIEGGGLVAIEDIASFRAAATIRGDAPDGCPDEILVEIINHELDTMLILVSSPDRDDPVRFSDQQRFKAAFATLVDTIDSLSEPLRTLVALPEEYVRAIAGNMYLDSAIPRAPGRPVEWRKDDFYCSLLFIYEIMTGRKGAGSPNGPTVRFIRAFTDHLGKRISEVEDADEGALRRLREVCSVSVSDTFLKDWFGNKGRVAKVHEKVARRIALEGQFNDAFASWVNRG